MNFVAACVLLLNSKYEHEIIGESRQKLDSTLELTREENPVATCMVRFQTGGADGAVPQQQAVVLEHGAIR